MLTILYKTQLCKHHLNGQMCSKGTHCHFADGEHELRNREDPLPNDLMMKLMNMPYNNTKTQLCKFWLQDGKCRFGKNCTFAHGEHELRKPYEPVPPKISDPEETKYE